MKYLLPVFLIITLFFPALSKASGFYLEAIGDLAVEGGGHAHYWYTGSNVTLRGIAPANSSVTVEIDGTAESVTASSSGSWSYTTSLAEGDHGVVLSAPSVEPYSFTLTIGDMPEEVGAISKPDSPPAGNITPTLLGLIIGTGLIFTPLLVGKVFIK